LIITLIIMFLISQIIIVLTVISHQYHGKNKRLEYDTEDLQFDYSLYVMSKSEAHRSRRYSKNI
jgi:hypothetical protein